MGVVGLCRRTLVFAIVAAVVVPPVALAHSFLIRSDPPAGARLTSAPKVMSLYFSEPFVPGSERVTVRRVGGSTLTLVDPQGKGAVISQALPSGLRGVFVVSWRVVSDDGHLSLGEFAFAVGVTGAIPSVSGSAATPWSQVVASWLVFIGLAIALGGLAGELFVWRSTDVPGSAIGIGLASAMLGAALQLILLAGDRRGGGFSAGLGATAIREVAGARPGKLTLALLLALSLTAAMLPVHKLRLFAFAPMLVAIGFIAARSHSGTTGRVWALPVATVHLATVALWVGALVQLVLVVALSDRRTDVLLIGVRRYSRLALPTVLLILATGALTAIPEFRSFSAVADSSYGRTLLVKAGVVGVALVAAFVARRQLGRPARVALLRRTTLVEAAALVAVLAIAAVLVNRAPPRDRLVTSAASVLGPAPLQGPTLRLAQLTGQIVVAIAATPNELQFTVVPPSPQPQESVKLTAGAVEPGGGTTDLFPRSCGQECFSIRYHLRPGRTVITAHVASTVWRAGDATFAVTAPIPSAEPQLLRRVIATLRATQTLHVVESVTSGTGTGAPAAGYTFTGRAFLATDAFASGVVDVRVIGRHDGVTELAFALPGSNIWYRFWIDGHYRLRRELILDPGHYIRRTFSYERPTSAKPSH